MTECTVEQVLFSIGKRRVTTVFDGGSLTSDSGVVFLRRIDEQLQLSDRLAGVLLDRRQPGKVQHGLRELLRQRFFQIALGYEDANDADLLRLDPAFQVALGQVPGREGSVLASQSTLSRLEERIRRRDLMAFSQVLLDLFVKWKKKGRAPPGVGSSWSSTPRTIRPTGTSS